MLDVGGFNLSDHRADEIIRTRTANGEYSVKWGYQMQFQGSIESNFWTVIWQVWAPSRYKIFTWFMLQNQVWPMGWLLLQEWLNQYFCPLYFCSLETIFHLLIECPFTRIMWVRISDWVSLSCLHPQNWKHDSEVTSWFNELPSATSSTKSKGAKSLIILVCFGCVVRAKCKDLRWIRKGGMTFGVSDSERSTQIGKGRNQDACRFSPDADEWVVP
jgi:hypothetical protein